MEALGKMPYTQISEDRGQINTMTKPLLEAACDERGLVRVGLKNAGMKDALRQHYGYNAAGAAAPPTDAAACEDCDDAEEDTAEYEVDEILEMRLVPRQRWRAFI